MHRDWDVPEFDFPVSREEFYRILPEADSIESAALAAHRDRPLTAETYRAEAGYGGLGRDWPTTEDSLPPGRHDYWPHDEDPQD